MGKQSVAGGTNLALFCRPRFAGRAGMGIEMQAVRQSGADARGSWSLTISSPAADAAVLSRNVGRLNERLQARAVHHSHIRIEERLETDDGRGNR